MSVRGESNFRVTEKGTRYEVYGSSKGDINSEAGKRCWKFLATRFASTQVLDPKTWWRQRAAEGDVVGKVDTLRLLVIKIA